MLVLLCLFFTTQLLQAQCDLIFTNEVTDISCPGVMDGAIDVTLSGAADPVTYLWSNGETNSDITGLSAGTYTVTATDALGCTGSATNTVNPSSNVLSLILNDDGILSCQNMESDLVPDISGGVVPYSFSWSTGSNDDAIAVASAGIYTVTITDAAGCTITAQKTVNQSPGFPVADPGPLEWYLTCATGPALLGGPGTSVGPQFAYQWTTFLGSFDPGVDPTDRVIQVTEFGSYTLTVSNIVEGCEVTSPLIFVQPDASFPVVNIQNPTHLTCDITEVTLNATSSSSGPQYSYQWTTTDGNIVSGGSTLSPVVDQAGTYVLAITNNAGGCTKKGQVTVIADQIPTIANAGADTGIPCGGGQLTLDGSASSSGVQYTSQWFTVNGTIVAAGTTLHPIVNLPGIYTLLVTDIQTGCTQTDEVKVYPGPAIPAQDQSILDVSCTGQLGIVGVNDVQGVPPNTYLWSDGSTDAAIINVSIGTYSVTVTDATGCNFYAEMEVKDSSAITLSTLITHPTCANPNGGVIDLTAISLFGPIEYQWSTGSTNQDVGNLTEGPYWVTVTYALGTCSEILNVSLNTVSGMSLTTAVTHANTCLGTFGAIDLSVTGGTGPYAYLWSNGVLNEDPANLDAGTYTVTVTGATGCTETLEVVVGDSPAISLDITATPATCGSNNGSIDLTVTGGTAPFTYLWSNGETNEDMINLPPGTYMPTVIDATGCTQTGSITVEEVASMTTSTVVTNASCNGFDGAIDLTVTGGALPYQFLWDTGATTEDVFNLPQGNYDFTVIDNLGCSVEGLATVSQISDVVITPSVTDAACQGICNGSIDLTLANGAPPFAFLWSNGSTDQNQTNLCSDPYLVVVTDANGCTQSATIPVGALAGLNLAYSITDATCFGACNGAVDLTVNGGTGQLTYNWSSNAATQDLNNICAGTYSVTVEDALGCFQKGIAIVNQPTEILVDAVVENVSCFGGADGAIQLQVSGGTGSYTYDWSNLAGTNNPADLTTLSAGTYTCTVTDVNGCTQSKEVLVNQSTEIQFSFSPLNVLCNGGNDGGINLSVTGGSAPYTYLWANTVTTQDIFGLAAGTYTVTITDFKGCSKTTSITIVEPAPITTTVILQHATCSGGADGSIDLSVFGTIPGFSYVWSNGTTTQDQPNVLPGTYTVTITDINGCTLSLESTIDQSGGGFCGSIKGRVFQDENEDCAYNFLETGLAGWIVRAENNTDTLYGVTDADGKYLVSVPLGTYTMKVLIPNGLWSVCPGGAAVNVDMVSDTVFGGDFPMQAAYACPALSVSIGTDKLRRCFSDNYYQVEYCNQGTQTAEDAYVTVILDPFLSVLSASIPYTASSNALHFELGDLEIGECGAFNIQVYVNCNAVNGQSHCTQASIFPDTLCVPTNLNWSGASLNISSVCNTDSLRFIIQNTGKGSMNGTAGYIVVEDGIMFRSGTLAPLAIAETMEIALPANGSTWRLEVDQEAFHPYPSPVGLSIEGCTTAAAFSTGFVNQFTLPDESPALDIDCTVNVGSFDPNDKQGYPVGYGAEHYIRPGTDIEYLIRFQNTGTDTAFTVKIIDTLSQWLDPASIRFGASSHAYDYDLTGEGVVHLVFENILLPDSNQNAAASHGFAKFVIKPRADAPLGTRIENTAAIYFDFNDPIITNTTYHQLGEKFITVGLWEAWIPEAQVIATPNPFSDQTLLELKGLKQTTGLYLQVFDLQGNVVWSQASENEYFQLKRDHWPAGVYWFKVTQNGRLVGNGKLVAE